MLGRKRRIARNCGEFGDVDFASKISEFTKRSRAECKCRSVLGGRHARRPKICATPLRGTAVFAEFIADNLDANPWP